MEDESLIASSISALGGARDPSECAMSGGRG